MTIKMMDGFEPYEPDKVDVFRLKAGEKLSPNDVQSVSCEDYAMSITRKGNSWVVDINLPNDRKIILNCGSRPTLMAT